MDSKYFLTANGEIYHAGIKGQKWGVRRYQNKDGTLTDAGKKRYAYEADKGDYNETDEKGIRYRTTKKGDTQYIKPEAVRYAREDDEAVRDVVNAAKGVTSSSKQLVDTSIRMTKNNRPKMDLSKMSDKEMRDEINRALLEKQYNDMFAPQKSTKGREHVSNVLDVAGNVLAVGASALTIAISIYTLREKMGGK